MLLLNCCFIFFAWLVDAEFVCPQNGCVYNESTTVLTCRDYIDFNYKGIKNLKLCNYYNTTLYLNNIVKKVPLVENITVIASNVSYLIGPIVENNIKILKINNSTLKRIPDNLLISMKKLQVFDVRNNSLDRLPLRIRHSNDLEAVYLENNRWNCSLNMKWALVLNKTIFKDYAKMKCFGDPYSNKPVVPVAVFLQNSQVNCPTYCECTMPNVVRDLNSERLQPIIEANCSNKGLTELPPLLPNYTKILRLERNFISNLSPLIYNKIYKRVLDLYLDHNEVDSIENLEGAYWLSHFRVLSLNGNKLTQLPTYALDNALGQNQNMPDAVQIYLGSNPWRCDCTFTPGFQEMLMKYEKQIRDLGEVKCSYIEGDENSMLSILSLDRNSVCHPPSESSVRALDLLNIVLASLIVLVLGKLAYDYYYFKKTGRLPWIVTKMP